MGFAIRGEDEYRTGFDRLKKWDAIIREQELEDKTRRGELNLTEKFLMEMNAGRGLLSKALVNSKGSIVRTAIQAITFSVPTRKRLFQWGKTTSASCP
eukprot:1680283-Prymnesium_polylepis.1